MKLIQNTAQKQSGSTSALVAAILAALIVAGGVVYFIKGSDGSNAQPETGLAEHNTSTLKSNTADTPQQQPKIQATKPKPKPELVIDPDVFCDQISEVGEIFGEELTGATIREKASFGPQVGCSWSGPYVSVYFGDDSYNRRNTGFGSENLSPYEATDQEAVKREKYAVNSGFEVEVKSDSGRAFRISQSTGRQTDLTPEEYKRIANIVNDVLSEHY